LARNQNLKKKKSKLEKKKKKKKKLNTAGEVKLADFGTAVSLEKTGDSKSGVKGTILYLSPEALMGETRNMKMDIWALGIVAIQMAEGKPPLSDLHPGSVIYSILQNPVTGLSDPGNWSEFFPDFVTKVWHFFCFICQQLQEQTKQNKTKNKQKNHSFVFSSFSSLCDLLLFLL